MPQKIFTVGHSDLTFMRFLTLIQASNVNHIIDIRSIPYSRRAPWSNKSRLPEILKPFKSRLPEILKPFQIRYTYLGHKLGGKKQPIKRISKQQGISSQADYDDGIHLLLQLSMRDKLALLCAEGDPALCHRQHIIAQTLIDADIKVLHILKNGAIKEAWKEEDPPEQTLLF